MNEKKIVERIISGAYVTKKRLEIYDIIVVFKELMTL